MSDVSAAQVKELREKTGAGIMDCKAALREASGNIESAVKHLREKGLAAAKKKAGREATEGMVGSYVHAGGKIGVLVEVSCETDFVARTDDFQNLVKDLTMQVAAASPLWVRREEVPQEDVAKEEEIYRAQASQSGKPPAVIEKIARGKLEKYFGEVCLLEQDFIRDPSRKVKQVVAEAVGKLGENIIVRRFVRYRLGESQEQEG